MDVPILARPAPRVIKPKLRSDYLQKKNAPPRVLTKPAGRDKMEVIPIDDGQSEAGMSNIGLILEGGGMRGAFTAGVLDAFMTRGIWIGDVYGVSAGACQACSYLAGQLGRGLRVWTDHLDDWRFCGVKSLLRTRDLFGAVISSCCFKLFDD